MDKFEKLRLAIFYSGKNPSQVARCLGTSPQNFLTKLKRKTITDDELEQIARIIGAEFIPCSFKFPNGTTF